MGINKQQYCVILMLLSIAILANGQDIATESEALEKWFKTHRFARQNFTKLQVYLRDIFIGPNRSTVVVARANSTSRSPTLFGLVVVIDDPITVGPESGSDVIGQAQGLLAFSSLEEISMHMTLTLVFTSGQYNGSSINLVGHNQNNRELRRVAVTGGTGEFLMAQGVTLIHTIWSNSSGAVFQYNVFVSHY